ncbi:hypothetical protein [Bacillus sp. REN3]|uniref:hypothetical protein n=1 Tax=Bacillus sp. REN3 TaxID=2802440 RepID=UPI001AEDE027|nr:hypothetical protein [Bacillus sp. REN3]
MASQMTVHPTIRKCLQHLDIIQADDQTKQIVYMYMETLLRERNVAVPEDCKQGKPDVLVEK